jgi:hypothetical protein
MLKFLSAYFYFFTHIRRIQGKCLSVYGEYGEFTVLCVTQNRLRIREKNLCEHGEDPKRHILVNISVNNHTNFNFLKILHMGWIRPKNHPTLLSLSKYCPGAVEKYKNFAKARVHISK